MLESPTRGISKDSHAKAFSRGFITVNNYFWFPPQLNLSPCFLDYLNFRCQGGEILLNLLTRKVSIEDEETYEDNKETEEKSLVVFDLLKSGEAEDTEGFFYSFCSGQVVSSEDVDHCINCHVCFEHSFWNCARYRCLDFIQESRFQVYFFVFITGVDHLWLDFAGCATLPLKSSAMFVAFKRPLKSLLVVVRVLPRVCKTFLNSCVR